MSRPRPSRSEPRRTRPETARSARADWMEGAARNQPQRRSRNGSTPTWKTSSPTSDEPQARAAASDLPPVSEWATVGSGGRDDRDYNLEAFVSAEPTLADHLAEQLALAVTDSGAPDDRRHLIDLVDEAGYLGGDLAAVAEKLGAPSARSRPCWASCRLRPAGMCARNLAECLAIQLQGAQPLRPGHAGAGRASRAVGQARLRGAAHESAASTRKTSPTWSRRSAASIRSPACLRLDAGAAGRAGCVRASGPGRRLAGRTQFRHAAATC